MRGDISMSSDGESKKCGSGWGKTIGLGNGSPTQPGFEKLRDQGKFVE